MPDGTKSPAGFLDVNTNDKTVAKTGKMTPKLVGAMAPKMKIGDRLRLEFVYLGRTRWLTKVTPLTAGANPLSASGMADDEEEMSFRISSLRSLRIDGQPAMGLAVSKARLRWVFVLPTVPNPNPGRGKPEQVSDPEIVGLIKQFMPGEEVCIDYETVNYAFVIQAVRPAMVKETGRVVGVGDRNIINGRLGMRNVSCPQATVIAKTGTRSLLIRPEEATASGLPRPDAGLADTVKGLQKDQFIEYTYYRQAGLRWLVEAQVTDNQTASRR